LARRYFQSVPGTKLRVRTLDVLVPHSGNVCARSAIKQQSIMGSAGRYGKIIPINETYHAAASAYGMARTDLPPVQIPKTTAGLGRGPACFEFEIRGNPIETPVSRSRSALRFEGKAFLIPPSGGNTSAFLPQVRRRQVIRAFFGSARSVSIESQDDRVTFRPTGILARGWIPADKGKRSNQSGQRLRAWSCVTFRHSGHRVAPSRFPRRERQPPSAIRA